MKPPSCRLPWLLPPNQSNSFKVFILFLLLRTTFSQVLRGFPALFNSARGRPIVTYPSQSTCGVPLRSAFCRSSTFATSVLECRQDLCEQECPRRTSLPVHLSLLTRAQGFGACVTRDTLFLRPGAEAGEFSAIFRNGRDCFLTLREGIIPQLGANGAFTLTFWYWQQEGNTGTIIEKQSEGGEVILSVRLSQSQVTVNYRTLQGVQEVVFPDNLPAATWTYLAIQVYDRSISYFVNDTGLGYSARATKQLQGPVLDDSSGFVQIGQTRQGSGQFIGRLEDMRFYVETLTNREIIEVYSGSLPDVRIQTSCRCPPSHPRIWPLVTRYCIRNGVPDNSGDEVLRLNNHSHPLGYLNDGDFNSYWVSAPLNDVTIEVNLGDQFQVFYVVLQFYSPPPKKVTIERKKDATSPWRPWQMYADDCTQQFDMPNNGPLLEPDSVNCIQFGTNGDEVAYSKGNITFSILSPEPVARPGHNDFYSTPALAEFVKASYVRVRLEFHFYVDHVRHQYYGIYEYVVTGRCNCNGHGESCDLTSRPYTCHCLPSSHTQGLQCEECAPLYNNKPFRASDQLNAYDCQACECYNHADSCVYDRTLDPFPSQHDQGGGGRCVNCQHNTQGPRCDVCVDLYYRPQGKSLYAEDVCQLCDCHAPGVKDEELLCEKEGGQCQCKQFVTGRQCMECVGGYYNMQLTNPNGCEACGCDTAGTIAADITCHASTGQCNCKTAVTGRQCDRCKPGFYNLASDNEQGCRPCGCKPEGALNAFCNPTTGQCQCKPSMLGRDCSSCSEGFWGFESGCSPCDCHVDGSEPGTTCDTITGQCVCKPNVQGQRCNECVGGHYGLGLSAEEGCLPCGCNQAGTLEGLEVCDVLTGQCNCKANVEGERCQLCKPATYNLKVENPDGCEACSCDLTGTVGGDSMDVEQLLCDQTTGQCTCLANRMGRTCDDCQPGSFLSKDPGGGCLPCQCVPGGSIPFTFCDSQSGQCVCYGGNSGITGRRCNMCKPGYYNFRFDTRSCSQCDCDVSGSSNTTCDPNTGQCQCKTHTMGQRCNLCIAGTSNLDEANPFGCSKAPSQQPPPEHIPLSPTALMLFWDEPDYPNGILLSYTLYRNGTERTVLQPSELQFNDTGLRPFTVYAYKIRASNSHGSTESREVTFRTPADRPSGQILLHATIINTDITLQWNQPDALNGFIVNYELFSVNNYDNTEVGHYSGRSLSALVDTSRLRPYALYTFNVRACTSGGCLLSEPYTVQTNMSAPEEQGPPVVLAVSESQFDVSWQPPVKPNGVIIFYELYIRGLPDESGRRDPIETLIFRPAGSYDPWPNKPPGESVLPPPATSFLVERLSAYTLYELRVACKSVAGRATSVWVQARTLAGRPLFMPPPRLIPVSPSQLMIEIQTPTDSEIRGEVTKYRIYHYLKSNLAETPFAPEYMWTLLVELAPAESRYTAGGFTPYMNQTFRVEACNEIGCINSTDVTEATDIGAPADVPVPALRAVNGSTISISWSPPGDLNGPSPSYILRRTNTAFNNPPPQVSAGVRFPGHSYYMFDPDTIPQGVGFTGIQLWFKTTTRDGLLMYSASEGQVEFIALQLRSGRPWFLFDPQGCPTAVDTSNTDRTYNDNKWHHVYVRRWATYAEITVDFTQKGCTTIVTTTDDEGWTYTDGEWHHIKVFRDEKKGTIIIDNRFTGSKEAGSCATGNIIGSNTGLYVGGLPKNYIIQRDEVDSRAELQPDFIGCIRDVQVLRQQSPTEEWLDVEWEEANERNHAPPSWEGCPTNLQDGAHFLGTGFLSFRENRFQGGNSFGVSMFFKTETRNGLLMFVHGGPKNYFMVQMIDGSLTFSYGSVQNRDTLIYSGGNIVLCDGRWHYFEFTKMSFVLAAQVDDGPRVTLGTDRRSNNIVFIASKVYLGGIDPQSTALSFIKDNNIDNVQDSYGGCLREVRIQRVEYKWFQSDNAVNVKVDGCPADTETLLPCQDYLMSVLYNGSDTSYIDNDLLPFTDYVYQIEAYNPAGGTTSVWNSGRTREAPPFSVPALLSASIINGYTIAATWTIPFVRTGMLSELQIVAISETKPSDPHVIASFINETVTSGAITNAVPNTNYSVHFGACTWGGCTISTEGIKLTTPEEPPENLSAPYIIEASSSWLLIGWGPPGRANGEITGYTLYRDGPEAYNGIQEQFNVTQLNVYTFYVFRVRACTRVGCIESPNNTLGTKQLPPGFVAPPQLTVKGTRRITVNWDAPDPSVLNGVLELYQIYLSTVTPDDIGRLVYNSSDFYLEYTLKDLQPGTTYHIRLGACTGGGCSLSAPTTAAAVESAPEGVEPPTIHSPSSSQLNATWDIPTYPNGVIIRYRLTVNNILVYTSDGSRRWYLIDGLTPWSLHTLSIEACTLRGCTSSDDIQVRTQESPPRGRVGLRVSASGPRTVEVMWNVNEGLVVVNSYRPNGNVSFNIYLEGNFYYDPENSDYSLVYGRRSLYSTLDTSGDAMVGPVIPLLTYMVQVNASNTAGFLLSNIMNVTMPAGSPDGLIPPVVSSPSSDSIRVVWQAAKRRNADHEPVYQIQFRFENGTIEDQFRAPTTAQTLFKQGLQPFTFYEVRLIASNQLGETRTEWIPITTRQDKPSAIDPPLLSNIRDRSVLVQWQAPLEANGIISQYRLYINNTFRLATLSNMTYVELEDLLPFSWYMFRIEACTVAGCTISAASQVIKTLGAAPEGLSPPSVASPTPTSILIVWRAPEFSNGEITSYRLERRSEPEAPITLLQTFTGTDDKRYSDASPAIRPYTTYQYRLIAVNPAGETVSDWVNITTKSARPGGVQAPRVEVTSATSMVIQWLPPRQPNGRLESYIIRLPVPRVEIRNTSQTRLELQNLRPFTVYSITVTACTDGGCTESVATKVTTEPSVPSGLSPPSPTPHSQRYISITWEAPTQPNGPELEYELSRIKIRQPLDPTARDFGSWESIYRGDDTYYDDRGLTIFTTYRYRFTVYNEYGQVTSDASPDVTTYGGTPTEAASVIASTVNHTSVIVEWTTPSIAALQGGVSQYEVSIRSADLSLIETSASNTSSIIISGLDPNTEYEIHVTIVVHGGESITSDPVYVTTRDGAPEGVRPPQLVVVNTTALRVVWMAPDKPNGQVIGYNIHFDGQKIPTGLVTSGSYIISGLQPYTIYTFKMEVCTIYDCVQSTEVKGTTAEAIPYGVTRPNLYVQSPSSIRVTWSAPTQPNGIILRYDLYRRDHVPCQQKEVVTDEPPSGKCRYYECGILESFCGSQCYSGPKTCCSGQLYDNKVGYECCGQHYVPRRLRPTDMCCGGKFYPPLRNHQCCAQRYVEIQDGSICCPDPDQDRVAVGVGNRCCEALPYRSSGSQLCCNGKLHDKYESQCCGGEVVANSLICCGNTTHGQAYDPDVSLYCCGDEYVSRETTVCCTNEIGQSKVHSFASVAALAASNTKCCGTERISAGLSCCNGVGFSSFSQTCADVSDVLNGCGTGVVCPVSQSATAFCNRCNFRRQTTKCGATEPRAVVKETPPSLEGLCWTDPVRIYRGQQLAYLDEDLSPFTEYEYSILAVNGAGSQTSPANSALTSQSPPQDLSPPTATVQANQLDTIYLSWQEPAKPNGEIIQYILFRDDIEIYRDPLGREFKDNNAIQPYQTYSYSLRACNSAGCVSSPTVSVATLQAMPEEVQAPTVDPIDSTSLYVTWVLPGRPNGIITKYVIVILTTDEAITLSGDASSYILSGLEKFGEYELLLTACSEAGCTNSTTVTASTDQDKPEGVTPPRLVVTSPTSLEVYWSAPSAPNGLLSSYRLLRGSLAGPMETVHTGSAEVTMVTQNNQIPGAAYTYILEASTGGGRTNSSRVAVTMPTQAPEGIQAPVNVTALGPRHIYVVWNMPGLGAVIDQFRIVLNAGSGDDIERGVGLTSNAVIDNLKPYTWYNVRIKACLRGVPNGCGLGPGVGTRTLEAPPVNQPPPTLQATGSSAMVISWEEPEEANGLILQYRIHRRRQGVNNFGLLINVVQGGVRSFTNIGPELSPYTMYEYRITAVNSQGETVSHWASERTLEAPPEDIPTPDIVSADAYSMMVAWQPPRQPNGLVVTYHVEFRQLSTDPTFNYPTETVTLSPNTRATLVSGLVPYTHYEVRVVVKNSAGQAMSRWRETATGQGSPSEIQPFSIEKISSGMSVILRWDSPGEPNGVIINYLVYERGNVNPIFQGLSREFEYRRLVPSEEYWAQLEACTIAGCTRSADQKFTTAEIAPSDQPTPSIGHYNSTHITIVWSEPVNPNGKILQYQVLRRVEQRRKKRALSDPVVIFETEQTDKDEYVYVDSDLKPYTTYEYAIKATNSKGFTQSPWLSIQTDQAAPEGLEQPIVSQVTNEQDKLKIIWAAPRQANGIIQSYQLQRNLSVPWSFTPSDPKEYIDSGLTAYTVYSYKVTVCTSGGCITSPSAVIRTQESAPYFVPPPTLSTVSDTAIQASWVEPQITNGRIREYRLLVNNRTQYVGLDTEYIVSGLVPYEPYEFLLSACTYGGCSLSSGVVARPQEAPPLEMIPPVLRVTSSTSIEISWSSPTYPNGVITSYEVRRDGVLIDTTNTLSYIDYEVVPGREYSYRVTAFNSKGSVESPPSLATTFSSSPSGLPPPTLKALSSASIQANWEPPALPNGRIYNYTLYKNNDVVYSAQGFQTVVGGLIAWTQYTFSVVACTSNGCTTSEPAQIRTLEAAPLGMRVPRLRAFADAAGRHDGVLVEWGPPTRPNGIITRYEVYRKLASDFGRGVESIERVLVYQGGLESHHDRDDDLRPFTQYEYSVTVYNKVGSQPSDWERVTTKEAPPVGIPAPQIRGVSENSITIEIGEPVTANGHIKNYTVFVNNRPVLQSRSPYIEIIEVGNKPLEPYTNYRISVAVCTAGGCTRSPVTSVQTKPRVPSGQRPVRAVNVTTTSMAAVWEQPDKPNGPIQEYVLAMRPACPQPYSDDDDEVDLPCETQLWIIVARGIVFSHQFDNLQAYTNYELRIDVSNEAGSLSQPPITVATTKPTAPEYRKENPIRWSLPGNNIRVTWTDSFYINGEVQDFLLYVDDRLEYKGPRTSANVFRDNKYKRYTFKVKLQTDHGEAETPPITFDPFQPDSPYTPPTTELTLVGAETSPPVYQEVWFIALIAIIVLVVLFIGLACCLRTTGRKLPYIRERMPLQPKQAKANGLYAIDPYNGSVISTLPNGHLNDTAPSISQSVPSTPYLSSPSHRPYYPNPTYATLTLPRRPHKTLSHRTSSMASLNQLRSKSNSLSNLHHSSTPLYARRGSVSSHHTVIGHYGHHQDSLPSLSLPGSLVNLNMATENEASRHSSMADLADLSLQLEIPPPVNHLPPQAVIGHPGYVNPAYSHMSLPSRAGSLADLNLDKVSHKSSKWGDDDDDEIDDTGSRVWAGHHGPTDSGLHSLVYGEEYDTGSERPVSVLKEHTMFTDTHL